MVCASVMAIGNEEVTVIGIAFESKLVEVDVTGAEAESADAVGGETEVAEKEDIAG